MMLNQDSCPHGERKAAAAASAHLAFEQAGWIWKKIVLCKGGEEQLGSSASPCAFHKSYFKDLHCFNRDQHGSGSDFPCHLIMAIIQYIPRYLALYVGAIGRMMMKDAGCFVLLLFIKVRIKQGSVAFLLH